MAGQPLEARPLGVFAAADLLEQGRLIPASEWSLDALAGRFIEIAGSPASAALTAAASLVLQGQRRGEWVAWVESRSGVPRAAISNGSRVQPPIASSTFFPPDFAATGIDLEALPVIRVTGAIKAARVADTLIRSGAFAVVIIDLGRDTLPLSVQTRLVGLAKKHRTALVMLTQRERGKPSGGSLVSLRAETHRTRADHNCFVWELDVVKDKRQSPGWNHTEVCCGPDGLC